jgi:RNA polymerase sigma-70 factor (ECF subfamily)
MARRAPEARPAAPPADERLLIEAAQKDPGRFGALYELHFERVYAYVGRRIRDRAATEDLTAEVFHKALASLPRFEWRGVPFAVWLYRIAANAIATHFEKSAREAALPPDPAPEPVVFREVEHRARLFRLVGALPEDQRRVIRLRFGAEKSIREIARALGRTEGAVKQLQLRALKSLRARMSENHG